MRRACCARQAAAPIGRWDRVKGCDRNSLSRSAPWHGMRDTTRHDATVGRSLPEVQTHVCSGRMQSASQLRAGERENECCKPDEKEVPLVTAKSASRSSFVGSSDCCCCCCGRQKEREGSSGKLDSSPLSPLSSTSVRSRLRRPVSRPSSEQSSWREESPRKRGVR